MIRRRLPAAGLAVAVAVLVVLGIVIHRTASEQSQAADWVAHTLRVIEQLEQIPKGVAEARSAVRGFTLLRDETALNEMEPALLAAANAVDAAGRLVADNPEQLARLTALRPRVEEMAERMHDRVIALRAGTTALPDTDPLARDIRSRVHEMVRVEQDLLAARTGESSGRLARTQALTATGMATAVALLVTAFAFLQAQMRRRWLAETEADSRRAIAEGLLAEQNLLLELAEMLQACRTLDEAYGVVERLAPRFFPQESGALSLFHASRNTVEARARWGPLALLREPPVFTPDDCWALRRGQPHLVSGPEGLVCAHTAEPHPAATLCFPLLAQGELLGVLHLAARELDEGLRRRAGVVGEQLGMALANLQLREILRTQSIRDALTGLFNRRYAEETLARELHRSDRARETLSVLMIDVDHFKRFNDTFGHDAGDMVLRSIAEVLKQRTRAGDVASRFGGEEMLVILPGSLPEHSQRKAEDLREEVSRLDLRQRGVSLGSVTISVGMATFPSQGTTSEDLLRSADQALYQAKREGRNRVVRATSSATGPSPGSLPA